MSPFISELLGTFILILLGNGVVANVTLKDTKGHNSGWIVITFAWGMAVFVAVFMVGQFSGAHINPAVTIGLAAAQKFPWASVPMFILAQMLGAMLAQVVVVIFYKHHYDATDDALTKRASFCTAPAIRTLGNNFLSEAIGTFVLVLGVLLITGPKIEGGQMEGVNVGLGSLDALPVGLLVFAIGMSLGGTTGYAINPARDLGPRLVHAFLPLKGKGDSDWGYSWVPVLGPIVGAIVASLLYVGFGL